MYCPQCGAQNEDSARFCTTCGLDMEDYKSKWQQPSGTAAGQSSQPPADSRSAPPYSQQSYGSQSYGQQSYGPPPYQQHYQQPYEGGQFRQSYPPYGMVPHVPSHMVWAILTLILCFWPTGIVAVVYASQVGNKLAVGDYAGAMHSSRLAKLWSWISFGIAIFWIVVAIIIVLMTAAAVTVY